MRRQSGKKPGAAILLAGGRSRRMGRDKCLLPWRGKPLIQHIAEQLESRFENIYLSANHPEDYPFLHYPNVPDRLPGHGPMMGLCSVMESSHFDSYFLCAGDMPLVDVSLIDELYAALDGRLGVCPVTADGQREPLFAFYRHALLPCVQRLLSTGPAAMHRLLTHPEIAELPWPVCALLNLNTPEDYRAAVAKHHREMT